MAGNETQESYSLVFSLERVFECKICREEEKELRTLTCCEKLVCLPCIEKLFADEEEKQLHDGAPICPFCQKRLTREPQQYPVNKMVQHFQSWAISIKKALRKDARGNCQAAGDCTGAVEHRCKVCRKYICHRCSSGSCLITDDTHDVVVIKDCVVETKEALHLWKTAKEEEINALTLEKNQMVEKIKQFSQDLAAASDDSLVEEATKMISVLTEAHKELCEVNEKLVAEKYNLHFVMDRAKSIQETELIYLVEQLDIYEENREIQFGDYESILEGEMCFDVSESKDGCLLLAKETGLDVYDMNGSFLKSVLTDKRCFTVEAHDDVIIVGETVISQLKTNIILLNNDYEEIRTWRARNLASDFTMVDGKIYLSVGKELFSSDILVHSLTGENLPGIPWNGGVNAITSVLPSSIVFTDDSQHKVYKRRVIADAKDSEWKAEVKAPRCLCVDGKGLIWVRSNKNDCLTILNKHGQRHQADVMDDKFTKLGEINDICVYNNHLYVAHETGCGRFPIHYQ